MHAKPKCLRGVFMTRCYTTLRLPLPYLTLFAHLFVCFTINLFMCCRCVNVSYFFLTFFLTCISYCEAGYQHSGCWWRLEAVLPRWNVRSWSGVGRSSSWSSMLYERYGSFLIISVSFLGFLVLTLARIVAVVKQHKTTTQYF